MLLLKNFGIEGTISGIQEIIQDESFLMNKCVLSEADKQLLSKCKFLKRRLEILNVRFLLQELGLNIDILYKERKPYCSNGFLSISHSKSLVAVFWSPNIEFSIDIELVTEKLKKVSTKIFSLEEIDFAKGDLEKLCLLWNCKECVYKIINNPSIEFNKHISIKPFSEGQNIYATLSMDGNIISFEFNYGSILNHTYTYGRIV